GFRNPPPLFEVNLLSLSEKFASCSAWLTSESKDTSSILLFQCIGGFCYRPIEIFYVNKFSTSYLLDTFFGKEYIFKLDCKLELEGENLDYQYKARLSVHDPHNLKSSRELDKSFWEGMINAESSRPSSNRFLFALTRSSNSYSNSEVGLSGAQKYCLQSKN
ncbi:hypothetical protein HMI56_002996, partial [Coelomomyces lativittatus]